ncbi:hypothetical protein KOR42_52350 [Thalassoglobus neptunius]|uniref:VWFA domain-containing protein n=1 Tax=Thalassoglobus neptunius TaxID=1938619 RepID=A0A5C5V8Z4_9PLAN|nr:VWA domain-containing protein [Thalassoglobus neptunius]TWT35066.1 hypothetical protein KOR42_52350 [Thalassoglobus neptunius]
MMELVKSTTNPSVRMTNLSNEQRELLPLAFGEFLDTAATATSRATFYNTRAEQEAAIESVHRELFELDRGVYAASLMLPGLTDFSRQIGAVRLLRSTRTGESWMTVPQEATVLHSLLQALPPQRMLKMFGMLRTQRINNARTRRLILSTVLGADNLEFWAVKYRRKLETALVHAWGRRTASILRAVLAKPIDDRTEKERQIVQRHLGRFVDGNVERVEQTVRFILGDEEGLTLRRLAAYRDAKNDLVKGRCLPFETLEGLRSRFHSDKTSADVLELTKSQLTTGQKIGMQRKAKEVNVEVEFDPAAYDTVRLYVYAYEMGLTDEIRDELTRKAKSVAERLPVRFEHAAILLDVSASMMGHDTQAMRPISVALALRDVLAETAERSTIVTSDGRVAPAAELIEPVGDTSLAVGLITLLKREPDVVFVLTDGYENAPEGRFAEVIRVVRGMGIDTPIHQFSPVFAAEARGVRSLSTAIPGLPVSKPEAIGLGLLKALFEADLDRGVAALMSMVHPVIDAAQPQPAELPLG